LGAITRVLTDTKQSLGYVWKEHSPPSSTDLGSDSFLPFQQHFSLSSLHLIFWLWM
jgi:hypothetical protein